MQDVKEFYILCEPIETRIGTIRFFKVNEYLQLAKYMQLIFLTKKDLLKGMQKDVKDQFAEVSFLDLIKYLRNQDFNLYQNYKDLFYLCFGEDVFRKIADDKELQYYLDLIKRMNHLRYEKPSSNPEIEKFNIMKRKMNKDAVNFEAVYTSVWIATGSKPSDMYIYEMYALFYREGQFKGHKLTSLFATVAKDQKIESWCKSVDMFDLEEKKLSLEDFKKKSIEIFK